ncbi:MAG: tol-pal system protein YbgF [Candidatus Aminicenantales bacterium]
MVKKISSGIFVILLLPLLLCGVDKSKKAYELIYKDVQLLKQRIARLDEKIEKNSEDINRIKEQFEELLNLIRLLQRDQASFQEDQKKLPAQYQILVEKIEAVNSQLSRLFGELIEIKRAAVIPQTQVEESKGEEVSPEKETKGEEKKPEEESSKTPLPSPSLSPQVVYNMAYTDYLKGNFRLAIEGFNLYREQFPHSPLSDNALYWIGECYFSLKDYEKAIEQFNELILNYPSGDKIAAAYLKKGISLMELGKKEEALLVFKLLISKYPLEEETKIAQQKIKELLS